MAAAQAVSVSHYGVVGAARDVGVVSQAAKKVHCGAWRCPSNQVSTVSPATKPELSIIGAYDSCGRPACSRLAVHVGKYVNQLGSTSPEQARHVPGTRVIHDSADDASSMVLARTASVGPSRA